MSRRLRAAGLALATCVAPALAGCDTGVEASPEPGVLLVTLETDSTDTSLVIVNEPVQVAAGDRFVMTVFQGKAFQDTTFYTLFETPTSYRQEDRDFDALARDAAGRLQPDTLFASYVPPGAYTALQFGLTASELQLGAFDVPVQADPQAPPLQTMELAYTVEPGRTTELRLRLRPLASVRRYRNGFQFAPALEVAEVRTVEN